MIWRIDDVGGNTDLVQLRQMIKLLKSKYVCSVWCCVSLFSKYNLQGSVYPGAPFKHNERGFFYDTDLFFDKPKLGQDKVISHGLYHVDHSAIQYDAQEMSIVSSCRFLETNTFVPPFNRWNQATDNICKANNINLVKSFEEGWKSLEHNKFDPYHKLWYFHPWLWNFDSFKVYLG